MSGERTAPPSGSLLQVLGVGFGIAVLVGNTIGMGILRTPGEVARHLPSVPLFLGIWIIGGLYALLGCLTLAELGAMRPRSGGMYPLVRHALGPLPGFVAGWTDWFIVAGSAAAISMVLVEYAVAFVPGLAGRQQLTACALVVSLAVIQGRGIRLGDVVQQGTSFVKGVALIGLALIGIVLSGSVASGAPVPAIVPVGAPLAVAVVMALQSAIVTYDGWNGPLYFGAEVRNPGRDIPRSMLGGLAVVMVIYVALNIAFLRTVPIGEMAGDPFVAATVARRLFGPSGDTILRAVMVFSMLAAVNALILIYSRVPYAMSRDGLLPEAISRVNPGGTPVLSLALGTGLSVALIVSNTFDSVLALLAFFMTANYGLAFAGFFRLRWREPDAVRPFRVPGYPFVPGLALAGSLAFLVAAVLGDPRNSAAAVLLLAVSWPVAAVMRRSAATRDPGV